LLFSLNYSLNLGIDSGLAWIDHSILIVQVRPASSVRFQSTLVWLFKSGQPARHVFSQRWFDCSSQASQLGTSSVNAGLIVQSQASQLGTPSLKATYLVRMINASRLHALARLHLRPHIWYGWSTHLGSMRLVRMSCTFTPRAAVQKADDQWEALDHNLMGLEWSEIGPLDQLIDGYKREHIDCWWDRWKRWKQCNIRLLLKSALELHLKRLQSSSPVVLKLVFTYVNRFFHVYWLNYISLWIVSNNNN